ncbi:4-oxalocrotonate tautomerase [Kyrpidia spormannii]|uniref:Tautomerase n=1 Tax=Kyrpidia spormannii TaxID=2055160 RepID=A0A2K8N7K3_9BACL|nr:MULTISPECIES: 2-hydroxymuconate tautomerase [Kyrpidia]ATY85273.1 4-oxalocrotonate tautomerase [Kyrpidia spormannii]MCL6577401.1 2-hydroxymuconate tautomerase family protein [Kyrpidia sp.]
MPLIQIHILEGRSPAIKKRLIEEVTEAVHRSLGGSREAIRIAIYEIAEEHWAVGGVTMKERRLSNS